MPLLLPSIAPLDWRTIFRVHVPLEPEYVRTLDSYFSSFAQFPFVLNEDGKADVQHGHPCIRCGTPLLASLVGQLLGDGFTWGLAHGEGHCRSCGWPARAYHHVCTADGELLVNIKYVILQYHPRFVEVRCGRT